MIAHTETARAVTAATFDSYTANGVGQWDWVLSDGACPECEDAASGNPHQVGDEDSPPLHPRCRCAASPVVESVQSPDGDADSGDTGLLGAAAGDALADLSSDDVAGALGDASDDLTDDDGDDSGGDDSEPQDLTGLSDDDVAAALHAAADSGDEDGIDRAIAELERRDEAAAAERAAAEKKAAAAERRSAKAQALEDERSARYDDALERGEDPLEAYAEIWGKDLERVRIRAAMDQLRANGYTGRNYEELCMSQFKEYAERSYLEAENGTRGRLLSQAGMREGVNPRTLFTGTEARARKWASEELLGWWQENGRLALADFKAANLAGKGASAGRAYFL